MRVVSECEGLGMTYQEYMNSPKWYIELMLGKKIADNQSK